MSTKVGIKETKEAVIGAMVLGAFLYNKFSDGVQATDFVSIMSKFETDEEFKSMIVAAYTDANKIGEEVKDLDFSEGIELGLAVLQELPKIIDTLKAKQLVLGQTPVA